MQGAKVKAAPLWIAVKVIWIALALLLLAVTLSLFDGSPKSDVEILLGYGLLVLTFPVGLLLAVVEGFVGRAVFSLAGIAATTSFAGLIFTWATYCIAGYLQWFVFLPWLVRKLWRREGAAPKQPVT